MATSKNRCSRLIPQMHIIPNIPEADLTLDGTLDYHIRRHRHQRYRERNEFLKTFQKTNMEKGDQRNSISIGSSNRAAPSVPGLSAWVGLLVLFLGVVSANAASIFYIDFDAGDDTLAGTATNTAWRTLPGTRTTDGTAYLNSAWGAITTGARITDNTTFKIKCGTTHDSAEGGFIWLASASGGFYIDGYTNLVIQADTSWGTGTTATLDGNGMTIGIGLLLMQIDGVTVRGLNINNSDVSGIQAKEKAGTGASLTNLLFTGLTFFNNGKSYPDDPSGSGDGQLNVRKAVGLTVTNCLLNGNQQFINGVIMGDSHKAVTGGLLVNCTATNHQGDLVNNDSGIGFKCFNSQLTFTNCTSKYNLKGFDCGEQSGFDAGPGGTAADILYKVITCTSISNSWGINFNGSADAYPGTITWYAINNLILQNAEAGINAYSAPHTFYVVNNVFDSNGTNTASATPLYDGSQITTTPNDATTDGAAIHVYLYNNIFKGQRAGGGTDDTGVVLNKYFGPGNNYTLTSDYNSYQQTGGNTVFCVWSAFYGPGVAQFDFGANGPGHTSGNWYLQYGNNTTPPAAGTGHFHSDPHSKGAGCTDTSLPLLNADYTLAASYPGLNLSTQPWYIAPMGIDRAGVVRSGWDMGVFEFGSPPVNVTGLRIMMLLW
jgi:hypothetical protein